MAYDRSLSLDAAVREMNPSAKYARTYRHESYWEGSELGSRQQ